MKTIKTRLISTLLVILTLLGLLPTSAFAATGTGKGITITTNQAYWSTRLLANGTPYSYRPPMAAGRLLYCLDSGLGYHNATPSYCDSFTYTSATNADADAVLKTAVANSGLGEMDAATLANVKWLMTYINDSKASNIGQLFMAVQTYVWDHQSYKGAGDGTGDAGGYANADTYDLYLSLIDWLLEQKAREDAEFQRQIAEYAEQGIVATIVEDDSLKWAVFALSSNRKNQSFFNYYAPRKLAVNTPKPDPDNPPAGDADITLKKVAAGTTQGLDGAKFNIYRDGQIVGSDVTKNGGIIEVKDVTKGLWSFVETEAPAGYCADSAPISVYVDTTDGDKQYTATAENYALPDMKIIKRDAMSGKPIAGTVFFIKSVTGSYSTSVMTGTDGSTTLSSIPAGVYVVREESVPEPYIVTNTEQTVALRPGKTSEVTFVDYEKPGLEIIKKNVANGEPIEGVTYRIEQIDGSYSTTATTDNHGRIFLDSVPVGTFKVTEINVPSHVILCPIPQEVALKPGETSTVTFFNALKPTLEIRKVDSVTGDPVKGAKFQIWYGSNHTDTGELNDLGTYFSDASGKIILPEVKDGWYKVTELEPASGYAIKEPATQECFISGGESKVLTFENTPLSAIIIRKVDSESGQPLEGAWFRIRYLGGTSGTGGTVVGEIKTSQNGTAILTGLAAGTYVCEEISAPEGYLIRTESLPVMIGHDGDEPGQTYELNVEMQDEPVKGQVLVQKTGDMLVGFETVDTYGYAVQKPVYEQRNLAGAVFELRAAEEIVGRDGTAWYGEGELVDTIITTTGGEDASKLLPLGIYTLTEVKAPEGYAPDDAPHEIELAYADDQTPLVQICVEVGNTYLPAAITLHKEAEVIRTTEANGEVLRTLHSEPGEGFVFGLFSERDIHENGVTLLADTLVAVGTTDENGRLTFDGTFPHGDYYVRELQAKTGWKLNPNRFPIMLEPGSDAVIRVELAQPIYDELVYTPVTLTKTDITGAKTVPGAQIEVRNEQGEMIYRAATDANGEIPDIPVTPGTYAFREILARATRCCATTIPAYSSASRTKTACRFPA